jgi:cytochrome oxidase assembly protein ShyY1
VSWRFARTPKWLVRHIVVVALVVTMVLLGFWQLRRLEEKRDQHDLVLARQEGPPAALADLVPVDAAVDAPAVDAVLYRRAVVTGRYRPEDTVVVPNRTLNGASGAWVLTPLQPDDGPAVLVNRGFVGFTQAGEVDPPPAPSGQVTVEGLVSPSQQRGRFGGSGPDAAIPEMARVDIEAFEDRVDYDLRPAYLQLTTSDPVQPTSAGAPELVPLEPPAPDEGPHLGYAVQWFIFATIAGGGYLLLLRKVAGEQAADERALEPR